MFHCIHKFLPNIGTKLCILTEMYGTGCTDIVNPPNNLPHTNGTRLCLTRPFKTSTTVPNLFGSLIVVHLRESSLGKEDLELAQAISRSITGVCRTSALRVVPWPTVPLTVEIRLICKLESLYWKLSDEGAKRPVRVV